MGGHFGEFVRQEAENNGLSVHSAAEKFGVSHTTMYRVMSSETTDSFGARTLFSIAQLCRTSVEDLKRRFEHGDTNHRESSGVHTNGSPEQHDGTSSSTGIRGDVESAMRSTPFVLDLLRKQVGGDPEQLMRALDAIRGALALLADDQQGGNIFSHFCASLGYQVRSAKTSEETQHLLEGAVRRLYRSLERELRDEESNHEEQ